MDYKWEPITEWPGKPCWNRKDAPFKGPSGRVPLSQTLADLKRETDMINARVVTLKTYHIEGQRNYRDFTRDGQIKADARRPSAPGVILTFTRRIKGEDKYLRFACDQYERWEDNLRAIAKTLEDLRAIDRYGCTTGEEQYAGFVAALPAPKSENAREQAARVIMTQSGAGGLSIAAFLADTESVREAHIREAFKRTHPDVPGNSADDFKAVKIAADVLRGKTDAT